MKWPTNIGYAITPLEQLFFDTALELAGGDERRVSFAYRSFAGGAPASLPPSFTNLLELDIRDTSDGAVRRALEYVQAKRVDFVLLFDVQPVHPMFRVLRQGGVKTIASYWGAPISSLVPAPLAALRRALLRRSRSKLDALIFESHAMADLAIRGRGVPREMIDVVPLGVDTRKFAPHPSRYVYEVLGVPSQRKVVVFSGHCTPRKGIRTLIDAAREILVRRGRTDVCFVICGNTPEESGPYEDICRETGIGEWVRFLGYRNDLLQIFQSAYCGVIPSSGWDSFPRSAVEMSATGLPVVASRLQGLAEAVLHEQTGLLFQPGNPRALADALEALLDEPFQARAFGAHGRDRCVRELNLAVQRTRFLAAVTRHLAPTLQN